MNDRFPPFSAFPFPPITLFPLAAAAAASAAETAALDADWGLAATVPPGEAEPSGFAPAVTAGDLPSPGETLLEPGAWESELFWSPAALEEEEAPPLAALRFSSSLRRRLSTMDSSSS